MRAYSKNFYAVFFLVSACLFQLIFFVSADIKLLLDIIPDDAAYYYKIAENFNKGLGFSFDGIHQTNGFQPLWQYIVILINFLIPHTPEEFYRIILIIQTFIITAAGFLIFRIVRSINENGGFLSLAVFLFFVFTQSINGMETALQILLLVIFFGMFIENRNSSKEGFISGIIFGLLLLARLDMIFFASVWMLFLIVRKEWKKFIYPAAGMMLIFLPYSLSNYLQTGHIQPISGALKSTFPHIVFNNEINVTITGIASAAGAVLFSIFIITKYVNKIRQLDADNLFFLIFSASILIHISFYFLFNRWSVDNYYFITYSVFLSAAAGIYFKTARTAALLITAAAVIFIFAKGFLRLNKNLDDSWHARSYDAAVWAQQNTPPDAVFAMKDAGNFAYLSQRKVINLDGLVNDYYYQEVLRDKNLKDYLGKNNVSYYVLYGAFIPEEYDVYRESFMSYLFMKESDVISFKQRQEVYRSVFNNNKSALYVWKMH